MTPTENPITNAKSKVYSTRDAWLEARRQGIGSSDAAVIMGQTKKSVLELYCEKVGIAETSLDHLEFIHWGHVLEGPIAKEYAKRTGRKLHNSGRFTIYQHPDISFQQVTPDRMILPGPSANFQDLGSVEVLAPGSLSIKNAGFYMAKDWEDEPPLPHDIQLQHELNVLDFEWGSFAALIGGNRLVILDVERNESFCRVLVQKEAEFWQRVQAKNPPDPDDSESAARALAALYPKTSENVIALPVNPWAERLDKLLEAQAREKQATAEVRLIKNQVRREMGESVAAVLPDGSGWSNKSQKKKAHTVKHEATECRVLRTVKGK